MFGYKSQNIRKLKDIVYFVEKKTPLDADFEFFHEDELGVLLNRLVKAYDRLLKEQYAFAQAQEEAVMIKQEQIRNKVRLTHNINHELKTPISGIMGYLETIINNPQMSPQQQKEFIMKCYGQTQRLTQLLADLSVIANIDEANELIEKELLSLSDIVAEAVNEIEKESQEKGIKIENMMPQNLKMTGNKSLLQSIFHNLITNSLLYSSGSLITIKVLKETPDGYEISFSDNGVGIAEEHLDKIFERFYRVDKGRSRKLGGTGLGLSIVKNAVNIHGGTILARKTEGGGLEFVFTLSK